MHKAAQAYFQTQVNTTSQGKLLILLYDGAIKFLNQAKEMMRQKDYARKGMLISKAMDIVGELDSSLNGQKGGIIAEKLHSLYIFCNTRLLKANLRMDEGLVDEVIKILKGLRSAFEQIVDTSEAKAAEAMTAPMAQPTVQTDQAPAAQAATEEAQQAEPAQAQGYPRPVPKPQPTQVPGNPAPVKPGAGLGAYRKIASQT